MSTFLEKDRFVLVGLNEYRIQFEQGRKSMEFARILDVARGRKGISDPASSMKRIVVLGLVERRQRRDVGQYGLSRSRASYEYRITAAGLSLLEIDGATQ